MQPRSATAPFRQVVPATAAADSRDDPLLRRSRLDLRLLAAPEPLQRTLAAVARLAPGDRLCVLTPQWPLPLLALLAEQGIGTQARRLADGSACLRIRR